MMRKKLVVIFEKYIEMLFPFIWTHFFVKRSWHSENNFSNNRFIPTPQKFSGELELFVCLFGWLQRIGFNKRKLIVASSGRQIEVISLDFIFKLLNKNRLIQIIEKRYYCLQRDIFDYHFLAYEYTV